MALIPDDVYAFPFFVAPTGEACPGMTLRDWFAGQALPAIIEARGRGHLKERGDDARVVAKNAYAIADWMLEARK